MLQIQALGGGAKDGAIHRAGGPQISGGVQRDPRLPGRLPHGSGSNNRRRMPEGKYVIHAVGPVWFWGNKQEDELLRSAYWNSLALAREKGSDHFLSIDQYRCLSPSRGPAARQLKQNCLIYQGA